MNVTQRFQNGILMSHRVNGVSRRIPTKKSIHTPSGILPLDKWPLWAKAMRHVRAPGDKGIGDIIARLIGDENSEAFNGWYLRTFGKPCGCKGRKDRWNRMYPL